MTNWGDSLFVANSSPSGINDETPEKSPCKHFRFFFGIVYKTRKHLQKKIDFVYKEGNRTLPEFTYFLPR
jgi:hypothetical protein